MKQRYSPFGFTLAELLIALAILGVIATFTIPKILDSGSSAGYNAKAKEAVSTVSQAYQLYKMNNTPNADTSCGDLTPYMNYVTVITNGIIDTSHSNLGTDPCSELNNHPCLLLHNGAMLRYKATGSGGFGGTGLTNAFWFAIDPDGKVTSTTTTNGPAKTLPFWLYYNGRVKDVGNIDPNTVTEAGNYNPNPAGVPDWFSWSN